ncbi:MULTISPECIES: hypothetical protein [Streptomycetaceae]|uniref:Uncharacterized protein n=1 Tax=Streptantibioticus cattleyicolor (strain ATCC 35852 / DSM 46488 / JCM 4925 / NBRC 14057 / NRRL 8057) TaxID=1003195 RepID=F8K4R3_STREN|nr:MULTISPECIES: hypothetical protein [Streptomycetaceae]AEW96423.1 hypothetical protein SCATT_40520 [Streptantibioticus cattleyicolor NRRL 8057 = DSM 46488]MYS60931.1 hypothetical protein [Streptomyces sp. SID5468]CCB76759.1 conserved protein of unknown function [Streptantibioticus cattleyicolor NRRL 8057 = DSM 46488]
MAALAWLLIPVGGAIAATLWAGWAGRSRRAAGDVDSLAGYERFREAMAKSHSGSMAGTQSGSDPS